MRSVLPQLREILEKSEKQKIPFIILMMVFSALLETLGVSMIVPVVTLVMKPETMETNRLVAGFCRIFGITSVTTLTIVLMAALIVLFVGKNLFQLLQYYVLAKFSFDNLYRTQKKLVHIFLHKPYSYYLGINTSDIVRLISQDTVGAFVIVQDAMEMCAEMFVAIMLAAAVFIMDPGMALAMGLMLVVLMFFIARVIKPKLNRYGASHVKYDTLATKWLLQFSGGIKDIKIAESEGFFEENYGYNDKIDKKMEKERAVFRNVPRVLLEATCISGVLLIFIVRLVQGENIADMVPQLSAFVVAAVRLLPSANRISSYTNEIAYNMPQLERTAAHIRQAREDAEPEEAALDQPEADAPFTLDDNVQLKNITFKYDEGDKYILENACMDIPIASSVGVVGTSGAGKTTAIDILLGLLKPESGQVLVDGRDIESNYHAWLRNISYIPQTIYLLDDTIRANVIFGNVSQEAGEESVWAALREAQLEDFVRSLPEGLDTQIGERGVRLSGGQRQRIGIARALYTEPKLLIFDEATSALDNETEEALMEAINSLHGRKTMIIIAHRLQTIQNCDLVYRVGEGKIILDEHFKES
jgi:ABC-type multidrug transport system fused ATPase/permease subunit